MAASLDDRLSFTFALDAPSVTSAGFGRILILEDVADINGDRAKLVTSFSQIGDLNSNGHISDATANAAGNVFLQNPAINELVIGAWDFTSGGESLSTALDDISIDWYAITGNGVDWADSELSSMATEANGRNKLALLQGDTLSPSDGTDLAGLIGQNQSAAVWYHDSSLTFETAGSSATEQHIPTAVGGKTLSADPDVKTTTWAYKLLTNIDTDTITPTEKAQLIDDNVQSGTFISNNVYLPFMGQSGTYPGEVTDGTSLATVVTVDWTRARVREAIAQLFLDVSNRNQRIEFNNQGFERVASEIRSVLDLGERVGHFNDESTFVNYTAREDLSSQDVNDRRMQVQFGGVLAGAVKQVSGTATLSFDQELINRIAAQ